MTFMDRTDSPECALCEQQAPLAHTSHGLLCSRCVLMFLRKPPDSEAETADEVITPSDVAALTATL